MAQVPARLHEYLTVGPAAEFLGVSPWTLRNWDKSGKLKPRRHPKNGYRIYRYEDLKAVLQDDSETPIESVAPEVDWSGTQESEHFVQFYESDEYLADSIGQYVAAGLVAGEGVLVVGTEVHRAEIRRTLTAQGLDVDMAVADGRFVLLDAEETLAQFMVDGSPDPTRFLATVGGTVARMVHRGRKLRAFGEMVALLWAQGNRDAVITLEQFWNDLAKTYPFKLVCGYPIGEFDSESHADAFREICQCHSRIVPTESYARLNGSDERLREIGALQQKARALEAEIAHRREVEETLRQADRRKDEFLAILAHELRNPLAPISNALQLLKLGPQAHEVVDEAHRVMERQVQNMVRIVDDLLEVNRITQGRLELRKGRAELNEVIKRAIETSRPLIESCGHQLTVTHAAHPVHLEADQTRLAQVFSNLLNNSAKYTPPGGHIELHVESHENTAIVSISDNGIGISAEALPQIFEMFQQVDASAEHSRGGLGVGLSLVQKLIEMHGGTVAAFSAGKGQGSEFVVRLPVSRNEHSSAADTVSWNANNAESKKRILVADDNRDSAMTLATMLRTMGHDVQTAHDGLNAVATAERFQPEVIFMDLGMPHLNGYEATRQIREQPWGQSAILVAVTGWGQPEDKRRTQEAGFDFHLVKPVEVSMLRDVLQASPVAR